MKQKPMFTLCIENEDFDIAFIPKSKKAAKAIEAKAQAEGQSLAEYFRNIGLMDLTLGEFES
jgi:hypothetical protein